MTFLKVAQATRLHDRARTQILTCALCLDEFALESRYVYSIDVSIMIQLNEAMALLRAVILETTCAKPSKYYWNKILYNSVNS